MEEILFSYDVCQSVCLCAADWLVRIVDSIIEMPNATASKFGKHISIPGIFLT